MITICKHCKGGSHAPITLFRSTRALWITSSAAWSSFHRASLVLVESFNKLPYVSICSTTGEWELTFQSAGPCTLWMHRPRISTSTLFITLNDWLTEWRPSVITPKHPPAAFPSFIHFFSLHPLFFSGILNPGEFLLHLRLLCFAFSWWKCRDLPFSISETTDKALLPGGQQTSLLGVLKMLKADLDVCCLSVWGESTRWRNLFSFKTSCKRLLHSCHNFSFNKHLKIFLSNCFNLCTVQSGQKLQCISGLYKAGRSYLTIFLSISINQSCLWRHSSKAELNVLNH